MSSLVKECHRFLAIAIRSQRTQTKSPLQKRRGLSALSFFQELHRELLKG